MDLIKQIFFKLNGYIYILDIVHVMMSLPKNCKTERICCLFKTKLNAFFEVLKMEREKHLGHSLAIIASIFMLIKDKVQ
jgi:hypothetical protein